MVTEAPLATDEELAARVGGGDSAAFGELYERYFEGAYDFTMRIVRDSDVAADVVQGTFTRAWESLQTDEPPRRFKAWLYTVARNRAIDQVRDRKRTVSLIEGDRGDEDDRPSTPQAALVDTDRLGNPVDAVRDTEVAELVWTAASSLSEDEYSLLDMHLRQQLTPEEMATELGVKSGTLYTRLSRLRDSVEDSLAAELLRRRGRDDCPELDALIADLEADTIDRTARRRIVRHANKCDICGENRRRFVTAAELLPAFAPIPATAGLQGDVWERLAIPDSAPAAPSDNSAAAQSSGGSVTIGGATVSTPVLIGAPIAAILAIVAAVALLGGGSEEPAQAALPPGASSATVQPTSVATAAIITPAASATAAPSGPVAIVVTPADSIDATPPAGKILVFREDGVLYLPAGTVLAPVHLPNCSYEHLHGPPMRSLFPDANGEYRELTESLGECGFGTQTGRLFYVDDPS